MWLIKRKQNIVKCGLLNGMTDTHSHLLWGVDDGSKDEARSRKMIEALKETGITRSFATPHIMADLTKNNAENLTGIFNNTLLKAAAELNFEVKLAAEYMLDEAFLPKLAHKEKMLTYDGKHILIEMSTFSPAQALYETIFEIESDGYIPVLAHPERYGYFTIKDYELLKERGCLFQMNLLSLTESYGKGAQKICELLMDEGMYNFAGTDIHGLNMLEAIKEIAIPEKKIYKLSEIIQNNSLLWI